MNMKNDTPFTMSKGGKTSAVPVRAEPELIITCKRLKCQPAATAQYLSLSASDLSDTRAVAWGALAWQLDSMTANCSISTLHLGRSSGSTLQHALPMPCRYFFRISQMEYWLTFIQPVRRPLMLCCHQTMP